MSEAPAPPPAPPKRKPAKPAPRVRPDTKDKPKTDQPRQWNVVLLDDNDHSYEYVMAMVQTLFAHPLEKAFQIAKSVDTQGRAICLTTHKEHAELKRDQILAFGKDKLIASCKGSMSAIIEPADFGDDESGHEG
ncbi:MAG TPA: ATP-dependent Clp protease adaptor ClpS [Phycisphaerales bacterium]|nr:ATP-dependent Clp protease adaptor ClpS [Phycisphaerales bacterium]